MTDRSVEPVAIKVPRDPIAYRPSVHFGEKFHDRYDDRKRYLDDDVVRRCIENGDTYDPGHGPIYFRETIAGVTFRLVIDVDDREVVTGYPISVNTDAALDSGRWTYEEVEGIREFIASYEGDDDD